MTIELHSPEGSKWHAGRESTPETTRAGTGGSLDYRGVSIQIDVQRTPDCVFGRADLLKGDEFLGRLSIGSPKATPEQVHERLAALALARIDIMRSAAHKRRGH